LFFNCLLLAAFCSKLLVLINFGQQSNKNWRQPTENLISSKCQTLFVDLSSKTVIIIFTVYYSFCFSIVFYWLHSVQNCRF
jgi:hypothetical protein